MQVPPAQLRRHLQGELHPVYWVFGDEQLLVDEACDAVFATAKQRGFDERTMFEALPRAQWRELFEGAANLSLFGAKRLLDVRVPGRGLDRAGSDALRGYLASPLPDTMLVCRAVGLEWRVQSSAWCKALEAAGAVVRLRPVSARELPRWLQERCRGEGLELRPDALELLAERVEGNLLAARQEIEKLKLLGARELGAEEVLEAVGDSSHFDTFALLDAAFGGQPTRVRKMLAALQGQGVAVFAILGALVAQLQRAQELAGGGKPRMARNRLQALTATVRRVGAAKLDELARDCALLDMQAKGMMRGDPWQTLESVLLALAGRPRPPLEHQAQWLWSY